MAANKFATMLHRNTNKLTLVLIYAVLEWILIILLLLNSLFSYLIVKFADYFGLKRPCLWCSRLDHIFDHENSSYRDLICEEHANEISKLGFCLSHRKLAESQDMCEDCSSGDSCQELSDKFDFFPWMNQTERKESLLFKSCSCCGVGLNLNLSSSKSNKAYPPCILIKPSWGVLDYAQKPKLNSDAQTEEGDYSDQSRSEQNGDEEEGEAVAVVAEENDSGESENSASDVFDGRCGARDYEAEGKNSICCSVCDYVGNETLAYQNDGDRVVVEASCVEGKEFHENLHHHHQQQHLEFYIDQDDCRLVPIEMVDSSPPINTEAQSHRDYKVVEEEAKSDTQDVILDFDMHFETEAKPVAECWHNPEEIVELLSLHESKEEESKVAVPEAKDLSENGEEEQGKENEQTRGTEEGEKSEQTSEAVTSTQETPVSNHEDDTQSYADIGGREIDSDDHQATTEDEDIDMHNDEIDAEVSIGTDIPDHDIFNDEVQSAHEHLHSYSNVEQDPSTSSPSVDIGDHHGSRQEDEEFLEFKTLSVERSGKAQHSYFSLGSELDEIEEKRAFPDTTTSVDNFHEMYNRMFQTEGKESGTETSMNGSVVSDIECGDGVLTMEKLKLVLRDERKALNRVYAELEQERSASAIAANQTMAMINRLQEEKAAMQMEALQYQRMMDEQSEYDQEAMQLLNELMVKREKEKQELEKELELCRKKIQEYEAKEKMMIIRRMKEGCIRSRTSSDPCSNAEDSDGLSIDMNNEVKEEDTFSGHEESSNQNTPRDAVGYLEESLASFEEEKLSILDQLKELEEKLLTLNDEEEEEQFEDIRPIEHFFSKNGNGYHENGDIGSEENGIANGHTKEMNGSYGTHHQERKLTGSIKAKRLLPLFNEAEFDDGELNGDVECNGSVTSQEHKKLAIEEEVDHVYERLQALEADREFLKHCISSLRKGDKGLDLLQEILQHLRDLRNVETRLRNSGEGIL